MKQDAHNVKSDGFNSLPDFHFHSSRNRNAMSNILLITTLVFIFIPAFWAAHEQGEISDSLTAPAFIIGLCGCISTGPAVSIIACELGASETVTIMAYFFGWGLIPWFCMLIGIKSKKYPSSQ